MGLVDTTKSLAIKSAGYAWSLPLITHDSFLDLSRVVVHSTAELEDAKEFSCISRDLRDRIIEAIEAGLIVLPPRHATIIKTNLIALYPDQ